MTNKPIEFSLDGDKTFYTIKFFNENTIIDIIDYHMETIGTINIKECYLTEQNIVLLATAYVKGYVKGLVVGEATGERNTKHKICKLLGVEEE